MSTVPVLASRAALLVFGLAWAGLPARPPSPGPSGARRGTEAPACSVREVSRARVAIAGGREVYVNPHAFVASRGGEVLLAGTPNFLVGRDAAGRGTLDARDSIFGVVLGPGGRARVVPSPVDARLVEGVRAIARDEGGWAVAFAERERPDTTLRRAVPIVRLWYGVYDGASWHDLEPLPLPAGARFDAFDPSPLARGGGRVAWALPARLPGDSIARVVFFERRAGRWSAEVVPASNPAYVRLAYSDSLGPVLAVVQPDPDPGARDTNSLLLYTRRPAWRRLRRVVHGAAEGEVHAPGLSLSRAGGVLTWQAKAGGGDDPRFEARAMLGPVEGRGGRVAVLDSAVARASEVATVRGADGSYTWVVDHVLPGEPHRRELRFVDGSARVLGRIPSPFSGPYFAVASPSPGEVLVTGLVMDPAANTIASLVLLARSECGAGRAGVP